MNQPPRAMIYGANGYTGRLIARQALAHGLKPVLAGRNAESVTALARELDCELRELRFAQSRPDRRPTARLLGRVALCRPFFANGRPDDGGLPGGRG